VKFLINGRAFDTVEGELIAEVTQFTDYGDMTAQTWFYFSGVEGVESDQIVVVTYDRATDVTAARTINAHQAAGAIEDAGVPVHCGRFFDVLEATPALPF
jgi:head-tail adaptor